MKFLSVLVLVAALSWNGSGIAQDEKKPKPPAKEEKGPDPEALKAFEEKAKKQMAARMVKEVEAEVAARGMNLPTQVHVIVEMIEVEHDDFSEWIQENPLTSDATEFRAKVQGWVKAKRGKVRETMVTLARSGQRAKTESITELIYPTEYDPAQVSGNVTVNGEATVPVTAPNPTAFETRNTGWTLEVDPVIGNDGTIDLNLAPEMVFHVEDRITETTVGDVNQNVPQPTFHACKVTTQVALVKGGYAFLGTSRLPDSEKGELFEDSLILMFVRADCQ